MTLEPNAVSKFQTWRQEQLELIRLKKAELIRALLTIVPKKLNRFFEVNQELIPEIINKGKEEIPVTESEIARDLYKFPSLDELQCWFIELGKAWKGVISVEAKFMCGHHHLKIEFAVVEPAEPAE